ncbi:hypothetical protein JCM11491_006519 [Sporobolomyces phaffii]
MLLDREAGYLAATLGVSPDQIKVILLLVLSIPLSSVFPFLPSSTRSAAQHLYALVPSVVFLCFTLNLRKGFLELVADSFATWLIVKLGVRQKWGKTMPWIVFAVVMGHLAYNHILRQIAGVDGVDEIEITGSQMVLTMKLISFAWSVYDGQLPLDKLDKTQQASRIDKVPSLLEFMGYCMFFPSILAGPSYTYRSYDSFTSKRLFLKETSTSSVPDNLSSKDIPAGRKRKAAKRFITALVFLGVYSTYGGQFGMDKLLEGKFVAQRSLVQRIGFMNLAGFVARTKYYAVWCMAETAFIVAGLGYNPQTKHYDASRNVRIRSIELAPNFKILLDSWNMNTNVWLRECIYKRVAKSGKKPGFKSTQITFITSALWHGFNPCYLLTFVLGGFAQSLGRLLRNNVRPFFLPPGATVTSPAHATPAPVPSVVVDSSSKPAKVKLRAPPQTAHKSAYDVAGIVATQLVLNFAVTPFLLLDVPKTLAAWRAVGYYGLALVFVPTLAFNLGLAPALKRRIKRRNAEEERTKEDDENERRRIEWEKREEEKRLRRGEGVPGIGMDIETMIEEEAKQARLEEEKEKKRE